MQLFVIFSVDLGMPNKYLSDVYINLTAPSDGGMSVGVA